MEVAVDIQRTSRVATDCAGWFIPGSDPSVLLEGLADFGLEPLPRVFRVAGGFFVRLDAPGGEDVPGTIRLAEVADNVFAPIDAELVPALLPDEVRGLTGGHGVVCLPGGLLGFDARNPLKLSALLAAESIRRRKWQPLPEPQERPQAIREFILDRPEDNPDEILQQGGEGVGEEEARPDDSGAGKQALGQAEMAAGKALDKLGKAFGLEKLRKAGGNLMGRAMNNAPRLSEGLLGKQEAALRDLLRKFREGKTDEALRRALPVGGDTGRGAGAAGNANLPWHNLGYSLGGILGSGGGGAGMWFTEPDVYAALVREYRKAAEEAVRNGDHRRAAFIYGKLLGDYRSAANTLMKAGLHRDAAALYLKKLNDTGAAARAYEAGGDVDDAVKLYRRMGDHVSSGDLLRRAGDDIAALGDYRTAGRQLAERGEYKAAGELMMAKANEPDEALPFYRQGWNARPHPNSVPCAVHMAVIHADRTDADELLHLTEEVDRHFRTGGSEQQAANYYNMLATLASRNALGERRGELRDRALTGIAHKLRQRRGAKSLPFDSAAWSSSLVSDAQFALVNRRRKQPATGARGDGLVTSVSIATGRVTAACLAAVSNELFVGYQDGRIYRFSPTGGTTIVRDSGPGVISLSCDGRGKLLTAMHDAPDDWRDFTCYVRQKDGHYRRGRGNLLLWRDVRLAGTQANDTRIVTVMTNSSESSVTLRLGESLETWAGFAVPETGEIPWKAKLIKRDSSTSLLMIGDRTVHLLPSINSKGAANWQNAASHWRAVATIGGAEVSFQRTAAATAEFAGCNEHGSLYWSGLQFSENLRCESRIVAARGDFLCAGLIGPGRVAGVTGSHVNWFRKEGEGFGLKSITSLNAEDAVACFHTSGSDELLILTASGRLLLVSIPD